MNVNSDSSSVHFADRLRVNLIVGTHHKTGTVWMRNILKQIGQRCNFHFTRYPKSLKNLEAVYTTAKNKNSALLRVTENSKIREEDLSSSVVHLVRDPRDVLVSATHYHQKSTENFLHRPWGTLTKGKNYKDYLCSLPTFEDKLLFEMNAYSRRVFGDMQSWPYDPNRFVEVKYEDIISDANMAAFSKIFDRAGFEPEERDAALDIVWQNSIFGGLADENKKKAVRVEGTNHIRSGASGQWQNEFTPRVAEEFAKLYQPLLEKYGYEQDDSWVSTQNVSS